MQVAIALFGSLAGLMMVVPGLTVWAVRKRQFPPRIS